MPNIVGSGTRHAIGVRYEVTPRSEGWELFEGTVPESVMHDEAVDLLRDILEAWASRIGGTQVARNLAIRWDQTHPKVGIDPDVAAASLEPSYLDATFPGRVAAQVDEGVEGVGAAG